VTRAPQVDEEAVIAAVEAAEGRTLARRARAAARAPQGPGCRGRDRRRRPAFDGIVIGGDSMFELDGQILGKPHAPRSPWRGGTTCADARACCTPATASSD
jgi:septum formation protein